MAANNRHLPMAHYLIAKLKRWREYLPLVGVPYSKLRKLRENYQELAHQLDEYKELIANKPQDTGIGRYRLAPCILCEVDAASDQRQYLFDYVAADWTVLGKIEPYWSVLSDARFLTANITENKDEFYRSGTDAELIVRAFFARNEAEINDGGTCLELGCGVGRSTMALAKMFNRVLAIDISPTHLAMARGASTRFGLGNVSYHHMRSVDDIRSLPKFDLFFCQLVLQHNPPPVIAAILEQVFIRLEPGGYCLFQVPTYQTGYRFCLVEYLRHRHNTRDSAQAATYIEMHVLPQRVIYRLMRETGIELIEVVEDGDCGSGFQSMTFFGRKANPAKPV
jgi:SAM-dependent methyltransferase